jgi:hypothetical protein
MRRWISVVLPPAWVLVVVFLIHLGYEATCRMIVWHFELGRMPTWFDEGRAGLYVFTLVAFGAFRMLAFHPLFRPGYRDWLKTTPWKSRQSLPFGPVQLVAQDVLIVGAVSLVTFFYTPSSEWTPVVPAIAFLTPYLLLLFASLAVLAQPWFAYVIPFGMGLSLLLKDQLPMVLAVQAAVYVIAQFGLRRTLRRLPDWDLSRLESLSGQLKPGGNIYAKLPARFGWPFDRLHPKQTGALVGYRDGIAYSLLAGWLLYALATALDWRADGLRAFTSILCFSVGPIRAARYCFRHRPPINIWGRLFTFRWIIPGYDKVFIPPICAVLVSLAAPWTLNAVGIDAFVAWPVTLTLVLLVAVNMSPTLEQWRLTGRHRVDPMTSVGSVPEFKQI